MAWEQIMGQTKTLKIGELLKSDQYIIPIYQRNYAWGDTEIELLLTDIYNAMLRAGNKNYYIGSLVVSKREEGVFEVIDGQQRLTTLTILASFLKQKNYSFMPFNQKNVSFEYRQDSDNALNDLFAAYSLKDALLSANFLQAKKSIEKYWQNDKGEALTKFIFNQVEIIRTEVPAQTDLNHYFEIMNTRGEQLEKHEVLKARLMGHLNKEEQIPFAKIWDACSDMSRYVAMGFDKGLRDQIFGTDWQVIPNNFSVIRDFYILKEQAEKKSLLTNEQEELQPTIYNIINGKFKGDKVQSHEKSERFNSVIDFPNFLMHVLRIYREKTAETKDKIQAIPLDEKRLLENFNFLDQANQQENIKAFVMVLLQCRYLFDRFVIKSDTTKSEDDHWSLLTIYPNNLSGKNTFDSHNDNIVMLLSMFHVSNPSRIYKNWLYAVLRWLFKYELKSFNAIEYIQFLENLSDGYYFDYYGKAERNAEDFFDLIYDNDFSTESFKLNETNTETLNSLLNLGTAIPNFIFNRLDYLLWKNKKGNYQKFRFTFRSSVEHFYPQNPDIKNRDEDIQGVLHSIGNLCLITSNMNSKFTNNMPLAKKANFSKSDYNSLKLSLMMEEAESWDRNTIESHGGEMINILNLKSELQERAKA